ncbi:MAG: hypothetical protein IKU07_04595 [Oscillospiraceae bacterium]|nr:hypothetical protein [Oscillospiraceae bacterium]
MYHFKLEEMTTEQKLGMTYCARPFRDADLEFTLKLIEKRLIGSVQVPPKKPEYMRRIKEVADYPIIIVCDTETGFPTSERQQIPLITLGACNKKEYYQVFAKSVVTDARKAGYNATWNPVTDIQGGNGPARVYRTFSDDVTRVCEASAAICEVYKRNGYMSCGKHYPGSRSHPYDSHMTPTVSDSDEEDLQNRGLVPYKYLMERDLLPSIMTSHRKIPAIDPVNAGTMSPKIQRMIRDLGWDGVCWSDSFAMMAILQQYGEDKYMGIAIAAGNDIVLPNYRTSVETSWNDLKKNYEDGMFTEERLNEAARRVIALQEKLAEIPECVDVFTEEDQKLYDSIAAASITAVCDEGVPAALEQNDKSKLFVILTPNDFKAGEEEMFETTADTWYFPKKVAARIQENFPGARIEYLPEFPHKKDNERVLVASTQCDEVVFVTYCDTQAYLGTDGMTRRAEVVIDCINMAGKLEGVVHFGNPYALEPLQHVKRKLFGYNMPGAQECAIDALAGKIPAPGSLPVNCKFK